jgi:hypothetical protein
VPPQSGPDQNAACGQNIDASLKKTILGILFFGVSKIETAEHTRSFPGDTGKKKREKS